MDLLLFGMKNRNSSSAVKRHLAEAALRVEKTKADLQEKLVEGTKIPEEDEEKLLQDIKTRIEDRKKRRK